LAKYFLSIDDDRHFKIATLAILKTIPKKKTKLQPRGSFTATLFLKWSRSGAVMMAKPANALKTRHLHTAENCGHIINDNRAAARSSS
jgi:hypothetical protein